MANKKVFIGVGHGGKDPGAVANGLKEKDLTLAIAKACRDELKRHGVAVAISRESDASENLAQRIKEANAFGPDVAVDIHINAGGGDGVEVFHAKKDASDDQLAKNIIEEVKKLGQNSRGLKTKATSSGSDYFGFIRQLKCPSVLVECAFIDNKKDIAILDTPAEQQAMGVAIAKGILKTLGIAWKAPAAPTPSKPQKSVNAVAKEVLKGDWGNGEDRRKRLKAAGYDPDKVQAEVNKLLAGNKPEAFKPYLAKVTATTLNVRAGAGLNYKVNTSVRSGEVFTIVEEKNGWGKLKSGAGWLNLAYTKKV